MPTGCPSVDPIGSQSGRGTAPLRFLYVGTLSLRKGLPYLIEAWRQADLADHAELWIAGNPEFDIEPLIGGLSNIRYLGLLPKEVLRETYRQADVMLLPTLCEGLAHAVLEALAHGLPILSTRACGAGDLIVSGENGLIVAEADSSALAEALIEMTNKRANLPAMGARSAERARGWTVDDLNAAHLREVTEFIGRSG